jgi:hypothetical protein
LEQGILASFEPCAAAPADRESLVSGLDVAAYMMGSLAALGASAAADMMGPGSLADTSVHRAVGLSVVGSCAFDT